MNDTYTPGQIADRLGIGEARVRSVVRKECDALVPDHLRMIPGGRVDEKVMVIFAGIFDAVASGRAVTGTAPAVRMVPAGAGYEPAPESFVRRRAS